MDRAKFFAAVRAKPFNNDLSQSQVDGINATLDAWDQFAPNSNPRFISYSLSTEFWETARTMLPIEEYGQGRGRAYGTPAGPWHVVYDGRGDVQLTWYANYVHATARLRALGIIDGNTDLAKNPELAMRPDIAAAIMIFGMTEGWFTGKKLSDYLDGDDFDATNARRIINGTDHAEDIANLYDAFADAINAGNS